MEQYNEILYNYYGSYGYVGQINDREIGWLIGEGATSDNINDAWREFLALQGFTGHITNARYEWLGSLGYTGSINDRIMQWAGNPIAQSMPLVWMDETSIDETAGTVNGWDNKQQGSGGAGYSMTQAVGATPLSLTTLNGLPVIQNTAASGSTLISASEVDVLQPYTVAMVVKYDFTAQGSGADRRMLDGFANGFPNLYQPSAADVWRFGSGQNLDLATQDTNVHAVSAIADGLTSRLIVSDIGDISGDAGTLPLDYGALFGQGNNVGGHMRGLIAEFIVWDRALSTEELIPMETYLRDKWGF